MKEIKLYEVTDLGNEQYIMCNLNYQDQGILKKIENADFYFNEDKQIEELKVRSVDLLFANDTINKMSTDEINEEFGDNEADFSLVLTLNDTDDVVLLALDFTEEV